MSCFRASHSAAVYEIENESHEKREKVNFRLSPRRCVQNMNPKGIQNRRGGEKVTKHDHEVTQWMPQQPTYNKAKVSPPVRRRNLVFSFRRGIHLTRKR